MIQLFDVEIPEKGTIWVKYTPNNGFVMKINGELAIDNRSGISIGKDCKNLCAYIAAQFLGQGLLLKVKSDKDSEITGTYEKSDKIATLLKDMNSFDNHDKINLDFHYCYAVEGNKVFVRYTKLYTGTSYGNTFQPVLQERIGYKVKYEKGGSINPDRNYFLFSIDLSKKVTKVAKPKPNNYRERERMKVSEAIKQGYLYAVKHLVQPRYTMGTIGQKNEFLCLVNYDLEDVNCDLSNRINNPNTDGYIFELVKIDDTKHTVENNDMNTKDSFIFRPSASYYQKDSVYSQYGLRYWLGRFKDNPDNHKGEVLHTFNKMENTKIMLIPD